MDHAIERLHHLIHVILYQGQVDTWSDQEINKWLDLVRREKEYVKIFLRRKSLSVRKERELELLVQQYQAEIVLLLDTVYGRKTKQSLVSTNQFLDCLLKELEELLSLIEHRYSRYFNLNEKVPAIYLQVTQKELRHRCKQLKESMSQCEFNEQLLQVIFYPFISFARKEGNVTYRQMMYLKDLLSILEEALKEVEPDLLEKHITELLVYMNFNSYAFVSYLIKQINNDVKQLPDRQHKVEKLATYLNRCHQIHVKPGTAFKKSNVSVKRQLIGWVMEEINFLERRDDLIPQLSPREEKASTQEKLVLNCSVEVLSLFARAAKDTELILNKEMTGMYKVLSKFCSTTQTDSPSAHSMIRKSYVAERNTKRTAIDLLHNMIQKLHKY